MRKLAVVITCVCFLFPLTVTALNVSSECFILMDQDSNRIIDSKNMHQSKLIASVTKIMTAIITIESGQLDDIVTVDDTVLKSYGSNIYIEIGEQMSLRDLTYGLMLKSGNDAAMMIAKYVATSETEFINLMNKKAKQLGMNNTLFKNPHGLDEETENYSTAYDIALLTIYAMKNEEYRKIVSTKKKIVQTNYKTYEWINKNQLLFSNKYITGGKNGYTEKANRTLVTTASKDNLNLVVVTLNDNNQWVTHQNAYDYAFTTYKNYKILSHKNFKVVDDYFYKDKLFIKSNLYYPLAEEETNKVTTKAKIVKLTGYKHNDIVGSIEVFLDNKKIHSQYIYVFKPSKRSIWQRLWCLFK